MDRRSLSVLFGVLLLLVQVLQGATADAMSCTADEGLRDVVDVSQHCGSGLVETPAVDLRAPARGHCPFCASGACQMAHAPALPLRLEVTERPMPPTHATALRLDERLDARISRILRPPR